MNQRYNIEDGFDELFAVADGLYNDLKSELISKEMKLLEHGDVEERVAKKDWKYCGSFCRCTLT